MAFIRLQGVTELEFEDEPEEGPRHFNFFPDHVMTELIIGLVLFYYFRMFLQGVENVAGESPQEAVNRLLVAFRVVVVAMVIGLVAFALYLWHISLRTFSSKQFPPPGAQVTRDMEMITGEKAKPRGTTGLMVAATLAAFSLMLAWYVYRMIQTFLTTAAGTNGPR